MKKIFFTFFLFTSVIFAQTPKLPIDSITKEITYSEVVKLDSTFTKDKLFSNAKLWISKTFNSSKSIIDTEDKQEGVIIIKPMFQAYHRALGMDHNSGHIEYTLKIFIKDGKYKYEITDFYHNGRYNNFQTYGNCTKMINTKDKVMGISYQKKYDYYLKQIDEHSNALINDIKKSMSQSIKNNDW